MGRIDPKTLDWDNPAQAGGDWVRYFAAHWEVILEAFEPYRDDALVKRAILSMEEALEERPEPSTPGEANLRFRRIRDFARAELRHAQQRAKRVEALARERGKEACER